MKIITDSFTRNYKILDDNNNILFSSHSEFELPDIESYYRYVDSIYTIT